MGNPKAELIEGLAAHIGVPALTESEIEGVLALAGVAAHGTGDRTSAPLACYLAGIGAGASGDRVAALEAARRVVSELAPEPAGG